MRFVVPFCSMGGGEGKGSRAVWRLLGRTELVRPRIEGKGVDVGVDADV